MFSCSLKDNRRFKWEGGCAQAFVGCTWCAVRTEVESKVGTKIVGKVEEMPKIHFFRVVLMFAYIIIYALARGY